MATVTERGSGGNNTAATSLTIAPSGTLAVGSLGVLVLAADNAGSGGATPVCPASITDSKGNVWTRRVNPIYDPGAAAAGVETAAYTAPITAALLTTDSIVVSWASGVSVTAKRWALKEIVPAAGATVSYRTGGAGTGAASGTPTVTNTWTGDGDTSYAHELRRPSARRRRIVMRSLGPRGERAAIRAARAAAGTTPRWPGDPGP